MKLFHKIKWFRVESAGRAILSQSHETACAARCPSQLLYYDCTTHAVGLDHSNIRSCFRIYTLVVKWANTSRRGMKTSAVSTEARDQRSAPPRPLGIIMHTWVFAMRFSASRLLAWLRKSPLSILMFFDIIRNRVYLLSLLLFVFY